MIASYAYTLDNAGHRTSVAELSGRAVQYAYDNIYRLTSETIASDPAGNNGAVNYTYDPVGNRTQMSSTLAAVPSGAFGYDADDRLALDTYDANGNTVNSGGIANSYDFENHLIGQGGATIVYDGDGNRVKKTVAGVTTSYLVADVNPTGYAQVVVEAISGPGTNSDRRSYAYGLERISQTRNFFNGQNFTQTSFYVYDGHGSVRALTDPSGNITDTYDYDAFGNLLRSATTQCATSTGTITTVTLGAACPAGSTSAPTGNEYLFAGEQFDFDLHLYYNRARYLNTSTGRFWTMDSYEGDDEAPLSLHKYLYTESNPVDNLDPSGNQIADVMAGIAVSMTLDAMSSLNFGEIVKEAKPLSLYIRAFAPWKTFGLGFGGDNRSFTTSRAPGVTSRITGIVQFLEPSFGILSQTAYSNPSHWGKASATANPTIIAAAPDNSTMEVWIAGANPLVPGSADIDIHLKMTVTDTSGEVRYTGHLSGDAFPDVEVFVVNRENQATMLDTFTTKGGRQSGPYFYLPGLNERPMGNFAVSAPE